MKNQLLELILISVILLTACGAPGSPIPVEPIASVTSAPPTATFTPTFTLTPEPTFTPTITATPRLPVAPGTQIPNVSIPLSPDNLDQIVELARWGKGVIADALYSPDGKLIAVATALGVSVYQADTLAEILYFETDAGITSLAYSPDAETLATGFDDHTVGLWNASDGAFLRRLAVQKEESNVADSDKERVNSVAFSPDGTLLVSGSSDGSITLWQVSDGTVVLTPSAKHGWGVTSVFFSPDGETVFSSSFDGTIYRRQVSDGEVVHAFGGASIRDAILSADGKLLAAYDRRRYDVDGVLAVWEVESGKKIQTISGGEKYSSNDINRLAFSPDGQLLAAAWEDHTVKIWDVKNGNLQNLFEDLKPGNGRYYLNYFITAFAPDGKSLMLAGADSIGIWDVGKGNLITEAVIKSDYNYNIAVSPDGQMLASVEGPNVHLRRISDGSLIAFPEQIQSSNDVTFLPDGTALVVSTFDNTAQFWPLSEQGIRKTFEMEKKEDVEFVTVSPDGTLLAMGGNSPSGIVYVRQISDGTLVATLGLGSQALSDFSFSQTGDGFLVSSSDQTLLIQMPFQTMHHGSYVARQFPKMAGESVLSPDGALLAGTYEETSLRVWLNRAEDFISVYSSPTPAYTITGLTATIESIIFSDDGSMLAVGYSDGTIEVRLAIDGTLIKSWKGHSRDVSDIVFTPDGSKLITASYDGTIRIWGIKP